MANPPPNILFIMCDQLRADYLSCAGHPSLETPYIDALAARGVLFDRAYCQSPICGPSRMSFYTGRYPFSHGATLNVAPLSVAELTLGDYLRPLGYRVALVGKTHMAADTAGLARVTLDPGSPTGRLISECGFEPFERDDGLVPYRASHPDLAYNRWLNQRGYPGDNPWHDYANSAAGTDGELLSGWYMRNARYPARVKAEHAETAYMVTRALDFIDHAGDQPWCLHLSFIKPHWPYIAPAPYHAMYGDNHILPANRSGDERDNPHPVIAAFMRHEESRNFQRDEVRETVIPAYMGLVKQIDDEVGRLLDDLDHRGLTDNTVIVFTSDHGDYLGDHWLGEKELFHEASARIPLIVCDPAAAADPTRGMTDSRLVEAIDLVPTFVELAGGTPAAHRVEGRSLLPLLHGGGGGAGRGSRSDWRQTAFSEIDYGYREARRELGLDPHQARAFMVRDSRYKYIHYEGFRPQLFDLADDPNELTDLGSSPNHQSVCAELHERLFAWLRQRKTKTTISNETIEARTGTTTDRGILIGVW